MKLKFLNILFGALIAGSSPAFSEPSLEQLPSHMPCALTYDHTDAEWEKLGYPPEVYQNPPIMNLTRMENGKLDLSFQSIHEPEPATITLTLGPLKARDESFNSTFHDLVESFREFTLDGRSPFRFLLEDIEFIRVASDGTPESPVELTQLVGQIAGKVISLALIVKTGFVTLHCIKVPVESK